MNQISNITKDANQSIVLILPDGSSTATLNLNYQSNNKAWMMTLVYNSFTISNRQLSSSPNLLKQWKNIFPFGLACISVDNSDPYYIDDFSNGRCMLFVLAPNEVVNFETALSLLHDAVQ